MDDKRRFPRMIVNLPVYVQVGTQVVDDLRVVDISAVGMQIQSPDFEQLKSGFDPQENQAEFEIQMDARMAWVQKDPEDYYLTGWEFVFEGHDADRGLDIHVHPEEKRRHDRLYLGMPVQVKVGLGEFQEIDLVDISPSGMRLRCASFDTIQVGLDADTNLAHFTILLVARLAWVQVAKDNAFLTGWEFGIDPDEQRIG